MQNFEAYSSKLTDAHKGSQTGSSGGMTGSGGQTDYLDKGLNDTEQRVGGKYYDADKVKGPNKKVTDKVKDAFHEKTGHKLPGTH